MRRITEINSIALKMAELNFPDESDEARSEMVSKALEGVADFQNVDFAKVLADMRAAKDRSE